MNDYDRPPMTVTDKLMLLSFFLRLASVGVILFLLFLFFLLA